MLLFISIFSLNINFDFLSKKEIFGEIFTIPIPINIILKYDLKNDFILAFKNLNKSKSKYSSIFFTFQFYRDIKYFKEFNINFNNITKLYIIQDLNYDDYLYSCYLKYLFSNKIILNILCFLYLEILCPLEQNLLKNINKFKSLYHLDLNKIKFTNNFTLKLNNLKTLWLYHCKDIILGKKIGLIMQKLNITYSSIPIPTKIIFPILEECELDNNTNYNLIMDFSNMIHLKKLSCHLSDFLNINLKISKLEIIKIFSEISLMEDEKKC